MTCEQHRLEREDNTPFGAKNASKNLSMKFISLNHNKIERIFL